MILTDTHTHLYTEQFDADREEVIKRAVDSGIRRFFIPAIDSAYQKRMEELALSFPDNIFLMAGLHPTHVKENYREELKEVVRNVEKGSCFAIGETGIDLYWDTAFLKEQQEAFSYQIEIAKKHKLPVVIHCRDAFDEVFEILESEKGSDLWGIFHCFTGTKEQALRAIDCNFKLGIGGVVTFKNGKIDRFLNEIDLKHIVLETDAPYLAPVPYRGKRNESSYLMQVAEKVAALYRLSLEEVARVTTQNSVEVFKV